MQIKANAPAKYVWLTKTEWWVITSRTKRKLRNKEE